MFKYVVKVIIYILVLCTPLLSTHAAAGFFSKSLTDGARFAFIPSEAEPKVLAYDIIDNEIVKTFNLGFIPGDIIISDLLDVMFVANIEGKSVTAVFLANGEIGRTLDIGFKPHKMLLNPGDQYAAFGSKNGQLSVWNLQRVKPVFQIDGLDSALKLTFSVDGTKLFVVEEQKKQITVIDLNLGKVVKEIPLPAKNNAKITAMSRTADGKTGIVSISSQNKVVILDLINLTVKQSFSSGLSPQRPFSTGDGRFILIANERDKSLTVLSALTLQTIKTLKLSIVPGEINSGWLDSVAFIMPKNGNRISLIDLQTLQPIKDLKLPGKVDHGLITSDSKYLVTAIRTPGAIAVIDAKSHNIKEVTPSKVNGLVGIQIGVSNNVCH